MHETSEARTLQALGHKELKEVSARVGLKLPSRPTEDDIIEAMACNKIGVGRNRRRTGRARPHRSSG